jgi:hypothetical protein
VTPPTVAAPVTDALRRVRHHLASRGAALEDAFVAALAGEATRDPVVAAASARQAANGALGPLVAGDAAGPGVASTVDALGWLGVLGVREGALIERAVAFLAAAQERDGSWTDPAATGAEAEAALVASACAVMARAPAARLSVLRRAGAALEARWSRERVQAGSYPLIAGYLAALASLPADLDVADEALQWCGRELERGFRTGMLGAPAVAAVFVRCDAHALPGSRLRADEVARALLAAQGEDGGFPGDGPPERAACAAAAALRHLEPALR